MAWRGIIEQYRSFLPVTPNTPVVTLGEGNTPLVRASRLADTIAPKLELYLKFEGANPTGSFKDRGMTLAISKAVEAGGPAGGLAPSRQNPAAPAGHWGPGRPPGFLLISPGGS